MSSKWSQVVHTWEQADSFVSSMASRGLFNKAVDGETLHLRQTSCGLVEGSHRCPLRREGKSGGSYCGACGCGDTKIARLDGEGYTKLHYPYLICPLGRPGFSNHQGNFDACFVINLPDRVDRLSSFHERMKNTGWPFVRPEVFQATDGRKVGVPEWWKQGPGAWGCLQSHIRVIEHCLNNGITSVLILEDDAVFRDNFAEMWEAFIKEVPNDWQQLYLGGQHIKGEGKGATPISDRVCIPHNVNRTHAYALRGEGLKIAYRHLTNYADHALTPRHHVDHRYGVLHMQGAIKVYAPREWLAGQAEGKSDINNKVLSQTFWSGEGRRRERPTGDRRQRVHLDRLKESILHASKGKILAVVLGPFRSGTSAMTGALVQAGAHPGHRVIRPNARNPKGFFEAVALQRACYDIYPEPLLHLAVTDPIQRALKLGQWLEAQLTVENPIIVAKHPVLCFLTSEMEAMWPGVRYISMHRPIEKAAASLNAIPEWHDRIAAHGYDVALDCITRLDTARDDFLLGLKSADEDGRFVRVQYDELVDNPRGAMLPVRELLHLSDAQYDRAVAFIDPALRRTP